MSSVGVILTVAVPEALDPVVVVRGAGAGAGAGAGCAAYVVESVSRSFFSLPSSSATFSPT